MTKFLFFMLIVPYTVLALEDPPIDSGSSVGDEFAESTRLPRALASGHNFSAYVPSTAHGVVISNPGMDTVCVFLIGIKKDGTYDRRFTRVHVGESKVLDAQILSFGDELYILSSQMFEVSQFTRRGSAKAIAVQTPSKPLPSLVIEGEKGEVVTVAVDKAGNVYFPAYPYHVGVLSQDQDAVLHDDGVTIHPRIR